MLPCELISRNGDTLRGLVSKLAQQWQLLASFRSGCSRTRCGPTRWWTALVPEALAPGAVAEPYALWAIERQPRLVLPCTHPAIVVTDQLQEYERLKLWLLNLGHTVLAEPGCAPPAAGMMVLDAMRDLAWHSRLQGVWQDEVLFVFEALGQGAAARLSRRAAQPFAHCLVAHRLADIAQNHAVKKQRRSRRGGGRAQVRLPSSPTLAARRAGGPHETHGHGHRHRAGRIDEYKQLHSAPSGPPCWLAWR